MLSTAMTLGAVAGWFAFGKVQHQMVIPPEVAARICAQMDRTIGCAVGHVLDGGCACSEIRLAPARGPGAGTGAPGMPTHETAPGTP